MTYLFATVLVVAALSLYRTGRLTSDKMELQNAADALAFSVSTVEARDLNFAAYTNRAMVANEVAIGQAIGMASWAYHWKSIGDFLLEYNKYLTGPTLGISNSILPPMAQAFTIPGNIFATIMGGYAKAMTAVNTNVNFAYGIAQQIYHMASIVNTLGLLDESIKANAPDGAKMSDYGVLMLLTHLSMYGGLPIPASLQKKVADHQFTRSYDPSKALKSKKWYADTVGEKDAGGMGRLAAIIHNSGDPFTKGHHNAYPSDTDPPDQSGRGWVINFFEMLADAGVLPRPQRFGAGAGPISGYVEFGVYPGGWLGFDVGGGIDLGIIGADVNFYIQLRFQMLREGGSEIRATIPVSGTKKNKVSGELFTWSSADATNFDLGFKGGGGFSSWVRIPFVGKVDLLSAGVDMVLADENLFIGISFGGSGEGCEDPDDPDTCESVDESADIEIYNGSFPTSAPLGGAFTWSGKTGPNGTALTTHKKHMGIQLSGKLAKNSPIPVPKGPIPEDAYGGAGKRLLGWYYPPSLPASGIYWQPSNPAFAKQNVGTSYRGLPRYIDTTTAAFDHKSGGPYFITALTLDEDDFDAENYDTAPDNEPAGQFALNEAFGGNSMSALAKSEVQFVRPLDINYYARDDGYIEHGSAFNPYWQARLIETSHADRVMSLFLENGEIAQGGAGFPGGLQGLASWISNALP